MAAFYSSGVCTAEDKAVVIRLLYYLGRVSCRSNFGTAEDVAILFQFGREEDPQIARKRLRDFVAVDLPKLEVQIVCLADHR